MPSESKGIQLVRFSHTCAGCGKGFMASRPDAQCCNATCRQRYKRACDAITRAHARDNPAVAQIPFFSDPAAPNTTSAEVASTLQAQLVEASRKIPDEVETATINVPNRAEVDRPGKKLKPRPARSSSSPTPRPSPARSKPAAKKPAKKKPPTKCAMPAVFKAKADKMRAARSKPTKKGGRAR